MSPQMLPQIQDIHKKDPKIEVFLKIQNHFSGIMSIIKSGKDVEDGISVRIHLPTLKVTTLALEAGACPR